ncbi:MAG TPA: molecular chaperone DnaJ, partial [Ruminococcaceae bacterium]|nr:molecular chaperone DnaJ [Oscillospiraceae bacterium]
KGKGDQYVRVVVEIPKSLNNKQKDMIRQFENSTTEKNYAKRRSFFDKLKKMFND